MTNYDIQVKLQELVELADQDIESRSRIVADAFNLAQSENDESLLALTIADFSPYLDQAAVQGAHQLALQVSDPLYRGLELISLASRSENASNKQRETILKDAFTTSHLIDSVGGLILMMSNLLNLLRFTRNADYLPAIKAFREFAETIQDGSARVHALAILSSHLEPEQSENVLQQAVHIAELIEDTAAKTQAFNILAPYLSR